MKGNPFTRARSVRKICATLLTVAMLTIAPLASAQTMNHGLDAESWSRGLGFVGCAVALIVASSTLQLWLAALGCAKVMATELGV